ncbi:MAG: hypothetical protein U0694_16555 [Anaerolineae bacterium]
MGRGADGTASEPAGYTAGAEIAPCRCLAMCKSATRVGIVISEFEVTATANVNVRLRPTTNQNNVIAC